MMWAMHERDRRAKQDQRKRYVIVLIGFLTSNVQRLLALFSLSKKLRSPSNRYSDGGILTFQFSSVHKFETHFANNFGDGQTTIWRSVLQDGARNSKRLCTTYSQEVPFVQKCKTHSATNFGVGHPAIWRFVLQARCSQFNAVPYNMQSGGFFCTKSAKVHFATNFGVGQRTEGGGRTSIIAAMTNTGFPKQLGRIKQLLYQWVYCSSEYRVCQIALYFPS